MSNISIVKSKSKPELILTRQEIEMIQCLRAMTGKGGDATRRMLESLIATSSARIGRAVPALRMVSCA